MGKGWHEVLAYISSPKKQQPLASPPIQQPRLYDKFFQDLVAIKLRSNCVCWIKFELFSLDCHSSEISSIFLINNFNSSLNREGKMASATGGVTAASTIRAIYNEMGKKNGQVPKLSYEDASRYAELCDQKLNKASTHWKLPRPHHLTKLVTWFGFICAKIASAGMIEGVEVGALHIPEIKGFDLAGYRVPDLTPDALPNLGDHIEPLEADVQARTEELELAKNESGAASSAIYDFNNQLERAHGTRSPVTAEEQAKVSALIDQYIASNRKMSSAQGALASAEEALKNARLAAGFAVGGAAAAVVAAEAPSAIQATCPAIQQPGSAAATDQPPLQKNWFGKLMEAKQRYIAPIGTVGQLATLPKLFSALRSAQTSLADTLGQLRANELAEALLAHERAVATADQDIAAANTAAANIVAALANFNITLAAFQTNNVASAAWKTTLKAWAQELTNPPTTGTGTVDKVSLVYGDNNPQNAELNNLKRDLVRYGKYHHASQLDVNLSTLNPSQKAEARTKARWSLVKYALNRAVRHSFILPRLSAFMLYLQHKSAPNTHFLGLVNNALDKRAEYLRVKGVNMINSLKPTPATPAVNP